MVNVTHDGDDWWTRDKIKIEVINTFDSNFDIGLGDASDFVSELYNNQFGSVGINGLVDCRHYTHLHQRFDEIATAFGHTVRQFLNGYCLRDDNFTGLFYLFDFRACHGACFLTCASNGSQ